MFALSLLKVLNFDIIEQERNYPVWHNKLTFMNFSQYTVKDTKEIFTLLESRESGLTEKEVLERQRTSGFNEIKIKEMNSFDILVRQFKSPFFYLLLIASVVALLIGERIDSLVIFAFVFINVSLGFFQESRAAKTASLLKKYIPLKARVKREGKEKIIEQKFLVPGDIVLIEAGNITPADLRILKAKNFLVDEEILSGESVPVAKSSEAQIKEVKEIFEAKNIVFTGSSVVSGEAEAIVIGTGKQTVFGEIVKLATESPRKSIYETSLLRFSRLILRIVVVSIVFIFLANLILRGQSNFFEFLIFSVALVVSIIPEALPVVVTFSFSQGAIQLARKKVVVKRLSSIEDLGNIEILCTDKTGTLTENKLTLEEIFSKDKEKCLLYGLLSSSQMKEEIESAENPFDLAILQKTPPEIKKSLSNFRQISEIPFDPQRLRNSSLLEDKEGKKILIVRGAPEAILAISTISKGRKNWPEIQEEIKQKGREGKRILAVAFKELETLDYSADEEKELTFLGYFSFIDPLKKTAKEAAGFSRKLGVQIKILTGDSPEVAGLVAKEIGLISDPKDVILGKTLESLPGESFEETCEKFQVFARVSPKTKFKIVEALQKKYQVGYLGEGINDAPALKIANVAIAVREGADISREVSDIILLKKDLRIIIDGIKEGRNIFSNINKYIKCTIASNFGNFYSIAAISFFIPFLPMLPIQILLVNLLSDFPLIAIATDKVDVEELRKPKLYQLSLFVPLIILLAIVSTIFDFIFFGIFHKAEPGLLQTLWFIESILTEIFLIYSVRTHRFFLKTSFPSYPLIIFSFLTIMATVILPFTRAGKEFFHFVSPSASALLTVISLVLSYFVISEIVKLIYFRFSKKRNP